MHDTDLQPHIVLIIHDGDLTVEETEYTRDYL